MHPAEPPGYGDRVDGSAPHRCRNGGRSRPQWGRSLPPVFVPCQLDFRV